MRGLAFIAVLGLLFLSCGSDGDTAVSSQPPATTAKTCPIPPEIKARLDWAVANGRTPGGSVGTGAFAGGELVFNAQTDPSGFPAVWERIKVEACWAEAASKYLPKQ